MKPNYTTLRGFNYQPSWGTCGLEIWRHFDADRYEQEVALGKKHFPAINALRIWLSHDAWLRDEARFEADFESALAILARHELVAIPVLFNRWHDSILDYGGIYIDHFLPNASWLRKNPRPLDFTEAIVGAHADDERVLAWDLCNEPFWGNPNQAMSDPIFNAEFGWLEDVHRCAKAAGAGAPITIGLTTETPFELMDPLCDLFTFHPYYTGNPTIENEKHRFERQLDDAIAEAERLDKPLAVTETCWGSLDDAARTAMIRFSLEQINQRGLGWLAYVLHESRVIDCHGPDGGPVSNPGNLAFINRDGRIRPGHGIVNDFT